MKNKKTMWRMECCVKAHPDKEMIYTDWAGDDMETKDVIDLFLDRIEELYGVPFLCVSIERIDGNDKVY